MQFKESIKNLEVLNIKQQVLVGLVWSKNTSKVQSSKKVATVFSPRAGHIDLFSVIQKRLSFDYW